MKNWCTFLFLSLLFLSCNKSSNKSSDTVLSEVSFAPQASGSFSSSNGKPLTESPLPNVENSEVSNKKIIKDGSLSIKSESITESKRNLDSILKRFNAYYETENLQNDNNQIGYDLKIRVPYINFEKIVSAIEKGKDEIVNKNIQARDVTEEFIDLTSRLESKQAYLKRYKDLLSKAQSIKDVLEIEEKIRVIQEEIESTKGRLKYLSDQVSYSSLSINVFQEKEYVFKQSKEDGFFERLKKALDNGWRAIVTFLLMLINVWPFLILIVIGVLIFKRYKSRINK